jgi:DNA-binding transcriptional regulator YiaG
MTAICDSICFVKVWTAKKIVGLRKATGMTQTQLANWLGVTRVHVSHLEADIRSAGPQTVRLLTVLEKMHAGKLRAVQPHRRRGKL